MAVSIEPTEDQFTAFAGADDHGPVLMLNLLRFKENADGIDAADGISGMEAYGRYGVAVQPFLERVGGEVVQALDVKQVVVGPEPAEWNMAIIVRYPSRAAFLAMISDPEYQKIHGHRSAGLEDSRLIACGALSS